MQDAPAAEAPAAGAGLPFPAPLASPLEPATRLAPAHVSRGDLERWVGLVDLGETFPFWLRRALRPDGLRLAGAVAGGAFSRFDLESTDNEFVEVHYRAAVRLRAGLGPLEARLALYHVSSHLGDEFLGRTGRRPISTSREGIELLLGVDALPSLRLYAGPGLVLRSSEDLDAAQLRMGAEWRAGRPRPGSFVPYAGAELVRWGELADDGTLALEAGLAHGEGRFRIGLALGAGGSRAEQFLRESETLLGLVGTVRP